jgi:RNA polymerase sigma-70 factor (ECF subfamily)
VLRDRGEAEDACQEAFSRIHRSFASYDPTRPLAPWIGRIAYHEALKRLGRSRRDGLPLEPGGLDLPDSGAEPADVALERSDTRSGIDRALAALSAQDRALVTLFYHEDFAVAEIAETTEMSASSVKVRLFRARQRLKQVLVGLGFGAQHESE